MGWVRGERALHKLHVVVGFRRRSAGRGSRSQSRRARGARGTTDRRRANPPTPPSSRWPPGRQRVLRLPRRPARVGTGLAPMAPRRVRSVGLRFVGEPEATPDGMNGSRPHRGPADLAPRAAGLASRSLSRWRARRRAGQPPHRRRSRRWHWRLRSATPTSGRAGTGRSAGRSTAQPSTPIELRRALATIDRTNDSELKDTDSVPPCARHNVRGPRPRGI